ncbi:hypothetical protein PR003_g4947 [Phytophthora rubi]|uniref:Uncharacterized protein n=1 Tax=Phytophthora rubi TaxID=129364 RepID=A0A6A3NJW2_9STRA|nr:hypothetical protein PR002_g4903 [Phytophthora rubi]KAE9043813.1 hypothetical protein PR001_g5629 [Phytophthora rubi]KAE9351296.1 hypothetical protein PR003_g4947 [Phytophthora rubi]
MCTPILPRVLFIVALAAVLLSSFCSQAQGKGIVTFYDDKDFKGKKHQVHETLKPQYCYNRNMGKPSSVTWRNQIKAGQFNGKAKIGFFSEDDCKGIARAWPTTEDNFPRNLALDGIDNKIKSFMLLETSWLPVAIVRPIN